MKITDKNKKSAAVSKHIITLLITASAFLAFGILLGLKLDSWNLLSSKISSDLMAVEDDHEQSEDETEAADLETRMCEHALRIIDCNECRYEAGVVKINPALVESLIETGTVENIERTTTLTLTGQVQLDSTTVVEVVPTGGGRVEQVKKLLGEKVSKGGILAVIHSADLGQVKADFLEIQAKLELTQAAFEREKTLYEKKITSQVDYQNALNELKTAQASYAATEKRLWLFGLETERIAGIKDEKENEEFANLILRAPQGGTIIAQNISVGKMADTTESLYTIADISNLWVWCDIYEKDLAILHEQFAQSKSLQAIVGVKAFEPTVFNGVVDFIGNIMDEHTRTIKLRVQVKNLEDKLRPGMFADVEIAIPLSEHITTVPKAAVMSDAGKNFVFQLWKDDLWVRRDVALGLQYGDFIEILSGIPEGTTIVTGGAFMLKSDILREKMGAGCAD